MTLTLPFRKKLSKGQVAAFDAVANALIFAEPTDVPLGHDTVGTISRLIQQDFLVLFARYNQKLGNFSKELLVMFSDNPAREEPLPDMPQITRATVGDYLLTQKVYDADTDFFKYASTMTGILAGTYGPTGFTPQTMLRESTGGFGPECIWPNCFGIAALEGSYYALQAPGRVHMAIAPDHPVVLLHEKDRFLRMNINGHVGVRGYIEPRNTFSVFRPAHEDNMLTLLSLIVDFDRALLFETLENIEFLRQVALGNDVTFLPKSEEGFRALAAKHQGIVTATDWKQVQKILFPDIVAFIERHEVEWNHSITWAARVRRERRIKNLTRDSLAHAQSKAFADEPLLSFEDGQERIVREMQRMTIDKRGSPRPVEPFVKNPHDAWEQWNEDRDRRISEMFDEDAR